MNDLIIFKHWFEGFCAAVETKAPSVLQWETLQERIHLLTMSVVLSEPSAIGSGDSHMSEKGDWFRDRLVPRNADGDGV